METTHAVTIERVTPAGDKNVHYVAVCSCRRWRSDPYRDREHAETKGLAHSARGDEHNRALASMQHGRGTLYSEWKWYCEQAVNPLNSTEDKAMWQRLATEVEPRARRSGPPTEDQLELFSS